MDYALKSAKEKFEKEQKARKDAARRKADSERRIKEIAEKRRRDVEETQRIQRLKESLRLERERIKAEADLEAGDGILYNERLIPFLLPGVEGDRMRLPQSVLSTLPLHDALDKGPMLFEITRSRQTTEDEPSESADLANQDEEYKCHRTHGGVLDFTAPEGSVGIPEHIWRNLGFQNEGFLPTSIIDKSFVCADGNTMGSKQESHVQVRYVRLPRATYARLRPKQRAFQDVIDHKAVLEGKLRQHATMTVGDVLLVSFGEERFEVEVVESRPGDAVTVVDADVEVDIVASDDVTNIKKKLSTEVEDSENERALIPLELGKEKEGTVGEGRWKYFKFFINEPLATAIDGGKVDLVVKLKLLNGREKGRLGEEEELADADLYVSVYPTLFPSQHEHLWSCLDVGSKVLCLSGSPGRKKNPGAGTYSVAVHGFKGSTKFSVLADVSETKDERKLEQAGHEVGSGASEVGFVECENCQQRIPERTIHLHKAYCERHNVVCQFEGCGVVLRRLDMASHVHCGKCGKALRKEEEAKHMVVVHSQRTCECGAQLEINAMPEHRENACPQRLITCRFCGTRVKAGGEAVDFRDRLKGLWEHEAICGARTSPCAVCARPVMLKEAEVHERAFHSPSPAELTSSSLSLQNKRPVNEPLAKMSEGDVGNQVECPVCGVVLSGADAELRMSKHLDEAHFGTPRPNDDMDVDHVNLDEGGGGGGSGKGHNDNSRGLIASDGEVLEEVVGKNSELARRMKLACPICGLGMHSERDIGVHIDDVH